MINLSKILFESTIDSSEFIRELKQAKDSSSPFLFDLIDDPKTFYEVNKQKIESILNGATEFKFLGSGTYGSAFSLGDKVLKLELNPHRQTTVMDRFKKERKKGKYLPMIYAHGTLKTDVPKDLIQNPDEGTTIYYTILEKFDTENIDPKYNSLLFYIILEIEKYRKPPLPKKELIDLINKTYGSQMVKMEANLRLSSNWLSHFINDIKSLRKLNIADLHSGNIGIRRVGGEGYFVFFD